MEESFLSLLLLSCLHPDPESGKLGFCQSLLFIQCCKLALDMGKEGIPYQLSAYLVRHFQDSIRLEKHPYG